MTNMQKRETKFGSIISNYTNGNRTIAAQGIRNLNKSELANLLVHFEYFNGLADAPVSERDQIPFKGFIGRALDREL